MCLESKHQIFDIVCQHGLLLGCSGCSHGCNAELYADGVVGARLCRFFNGHDLICSLI